MGLRKKILAVLEQQGLDASQALLNISTIVREPKKAKLPKPLVTFEIRREKSEPGTKKYRIDAIGKGAAPTSAIVALDQALEGYKNEVAECDCPACEQLKSRGEV